MINRVLPAAFALLLLAAATDAQVKDAGVAPARAQSAAGEDAKKKAQFRQEFVKATEEYEASLNQLAETYEESLKKQTEQNGKLKELYAEGLISRRELEASDAAVAEARAQLEDVRRQVGQAKEAKAAALKPPVEEPANAQAAAVAAPVSRAWTTGNRGVDALINYYGGRYGVDPYLVYCVMHQESRFGAGATSNKGAMGLMQLMPATAARYGVTNPYDPAQSIMGGTRYLKDLLGLFGGRIDLVLAGYNAGEGSVMKYGNRVPPYAETQAYVRAIGSRYGQAKHTVQPMLKVMPEARPDKGR